MDMMDSHKISMVHETETDGVVLKFYYLGEACRISVIDHSAAKAAASYQGIIQDLELVEASLRHARTLRTTMNDNQTINQFTLTDVNHIILSNIYISAIVTYAKCFTKADGRGVKLERSQLPAVFTPKQMISHDEIMNTRHNWAAHGGSSDNESMKPLMVFDPTKAKLPVVVYASSFRYIPDTIFMNDFYEMCEPLIKLSREKTDKSNKNFVKHPFTMDYLDSLFRASKPYLAVHKL